MDILITGATGFIGIALCRRLASDHNVVGIYHRKEPVKPVNPVNIVWEGADMTNGSSITAICEKYSPDVVIHCAGVSHRKIGSLGASSYMRVNSKATEDLAKAASKSNPGVCFIFLSSISVYGEDPQMTERKPKKTNNNGVDENIHYKSLNNYAYSKLDAERRLIALAGEGILRSLIILRLAPVYDRKWSLNLDRRVLAPLNVAYIRFGSGLQKLSALARPNLIDFVEFLIRRLHRLLEIDIDRCPTIAHIDADENNIKKSWARQNNLCRQRNSEIYIFNVCDIEAYEFNKVIQIFQNSRIRPTRPVIPVPLPLVWLATRIAGTLFPHKRGWLHSCYDKLASNLVFDNEKMLTTGFRPCHSLETIFGSQITQMHAD